MEKITDYSVISAQISRAFRRGVQTNMTLSAGDLRRSAADGTLFCETSGSDLFIFRDMGGYYRMYFYTSGDRCPALPEKPVVAEIAFAEKSAEKAAETVEKLKKSGLNVHMERERYTRPASPAVPLPTFTEPSLSAGSASGISESAFQVTESGCAVTESGCVVTESGCVVTESGCAVTGAASGDIPAILRLMDVCFPKMTGCIPTAAELCEASAAGRILCTRTKAGSVNGILHIEPGKAATELRHLAVLPEFRKKHLAQRLFQAYIEKTHGKKSRVWVRVGNTPAENFYKKNGYSLDGYRSVILISGKDI